MNPRLEGNTKHQAALEKAFSIMAKAGTNFKLERPPIVVPELTYEQEKIALPRYELRKKFVFMLMNPEELHADLFTVRNGDALADALEQCDTEDIVDFIVTLAKYYLEAQS